MTVVMAGQRWRYCDYSYSSGSMPWRWHMGKSWWWWQPWPSAPMLEIHNMGLQSDDPHVGGWLACRWRVGGRRHCGRRSGNHNHGQEVRVLVLLCLCCGWWLVVGWGRLSLGWARCCWCLLISYVLLLKANEWIQIQISFFILNNPLDQ